MRTSRSIMVLGFVAALAAQTARPQEAGFKLVTNASNGVSSVARDEASQYFLKKRAVWSGGQPVLPVDQAEESAVRRAFSKEILKKDVAAVKSYWQTQIFSGRSVPPPEKPSDAAVLEFVGANPGAIGYISAAAEMVRGVKEVRLH